MAKRSEIFLILAIFFTEIDGLFGQIPVIETPKPATLFTVPSYNNPTPPVRQVNPFPNVPNPHNPNPLDMYEREKRELQQRNAEILYEYEDSPDFVTGTPDSKTTLQTAVV